MPTTVWSSAVNEVRNVNSSQKLDDILKQWMENHKAGRSPSELRVQVATYVHVRGKRYYQSKFAFIIPLSFLLRDKLNPLTPFHVRRFIMTNILFLI